MSYTIVMELDLKRYYEDMEYDDENLKKLIEDTIYNKPEKHYFMKECDNKENKYMNQIGG